MLTQAITGTFANSDQRIADRRVLRLEAQLSAEDAREGALIHNLSGTGMLLSANLDLSVGETIRIELPTSETREAEVVWADEGLFGCRFDEPLSQATLSAAYLRSRPDGPRAAKLPEPTAQLARLQRHWPMEGLDPASTPFAQHGLASTEQKLPLGQRAWSVIGLAAGAWVVTGAIAYAIWQVAL